MKKYSLIGTKRTIAGKKVKNLRKEGKIPATIYGKTVKSASVTIAEDAFKKVYGQAGETGLIELSVDKDLRPVLVHNVQIDPVSDALLHVEFHQVDLKEKVHAKVPVELIGESPAIAQKLGVLLTVLDEIEVEALPTDLPEKIIVDVSGLAAVNNEVKVSDLAIPGEVTLITDLELTVVKVGPLVTKEAEQQAAAEEAAAAEAAATPAEGTTTPAEGEAAAAPATPEATPKATEGK